MGGGLGTAEEGREEKHRRRRLRELRRASRRAAQDRVEVLKHEGLAVRRSLLLEHLSSQPRGVGDEGEGNRGLGRRPRPGSSGGALQLPATPSRGRGPSSPSSPSSAAAAAPASSAAAEAGDWALPALVSPVQTSLRSKQQQQQQQQQQQSMTRAVDRQEEQEQEREQEQRGDGLLPGALLEEEDEGSSIA